MIDKIPETLEECFEQMKTFEGLDEFKQVSEGEVWAYHHSVGRNIRNEWKLWDEEKHPLTKYFNDLGIWHADDMSSIILLSFHRHLHNKDLKIQEQVKFYKDYWEQQENKREEIWLP